MIVITELLFDRSQMGFVSLWFWSYESVKRVKIIVVNTTRENKVAIFFYFLKMSKVTDAQQACSGSDTKMAVHIFGIIQFLRAGPRDLSVYSIP